MGVGLDDVVVEVAWYSPGSCGRWWSCSTTAVVVGTTLVGGGGGGGGKGTTDDGLRLNHASRFGHVRAALSDGHTPMLYCQIEHEVRAPR